MLIIGLQQAKIVQTAENRKPARRQGIRLLAEKTNLSSGSVLF